MKKVLFLLFAVLFTIGTVSDGYATPVEHNNVATESTFSASDDGEEGSTLLAYNQGSHDERLAQAAPDVEVPDVPEDDSLDQIAEDAIEHWYDRPVGESIPAWLGWIVAAAFILYRGYKVLSGKTGDGK